MEERDEEGSGVNLASKLGVLGPGLKTWIVIEGPGFKTECVMGPKNSTDGGTLNGFEGLIPEFVSNYSI